MILQRLIIVEKPSKKAVVTLLQLALESNRLFFIANHSPNATSEYGTFRVNVGEENIYIFTVVDDNDFNVTIQGVAPQGSVFVDNEDDTYTFTWTPTSIPAEELSFVAIDELGAATIHTPLLQVCACFNGGECTHQRVPSTTRRIQNLPCLCTDGKAILQLIIA